MSEEKYRIEYTKDGRSEEFFCDDYNTAYAFCCEYRKIGYFVTLEEAIRRWHKVGEFVPSATSTKTGDEE